MNLDVSGLDDGTLDVTSDASDAAGNSAPQATDTADMDTTPPTITLDTLPAINEDTQSSYPITGSCTAP